jgi:hypothetical protein
MIAEIRAIGLFVSELDAINGTPVLDIKPIMAEFLAPERRATRKSHPRTGRRRKRVSGLSPSGRQSGRSVISSSRRNRIPPSHAAGDLWRLLLDPGGIDDEFERVRVLVLLHQLEIDKPFGTRN